MKNRIRFVPVLLFALVACSSDGSTGPDTSSKTLSYETIAGTYSGAMVGLSQGVAMNSVFSLTINQSSGTTAGTWGLSGTLSDGFNSLQVAGTGALDGTVAAGTNPSVNLTIKSSVCPAYRANFSGAYDSVNKRITITGPVDFFAANSCTVALTYNTTIILNR
jgi:hypothetical protein